MRPIANFMIAGTLALGAMGASTAAKATTYTLSSFLQGDLGGANQTGVTDHDGGCDDDTGFNFGGLGHGVAGNTTCGDTLQIQWLASGTIGTANGPLTTTSTFNNTGLEFHVEDSHSGGTGGNIAETLTVSGQGSATVFDIPYTIAFGSNFDTFQIPAFDITVCTQVSGNHCHNGDQFFVISSGTPTLGMQAGGISQGGNDEGAFETSLIGCVIQTDTAPTGTQVSACQATTPSVSSFVANDPPPPDDVPEPASLAILGSALAALRLARHRRA